MLRQAVTRRLDLDRPAYLDLAIRQTAKRIAARYLDFLTYAEEFIREGYYARPDCGGHMTPDGYFESVGVSYRSVKRWLSIIEGIRRVPEPERAPLKAALVELGIQKASILSPILGDPAIPWTTWTERATTVDRERLQDEVTAARGRPPRRAAGAPGEAWYRALLARLDDDQQELVARAFALAQREAQTANPIGQFMALVAEFIQTYERKWALVDQAASASEATT
jgi:hypothetical protein